MKKLNDISQVVIVLIGIGALALLLWEPTLRQECARHAL